jgi:hypothetical protein
MHADLNDFLFRETKAGKRVVLFIDEAQNLSDSVLETVRLLSDFEALDRKLLQIVLAGQPELEQRLLRPGLTQLGQRIAVRARLDALPSAEVVRYMNHRLHVAGYPGMQLFTPEASAAIAEYSRGVPRLINHLCFNSLSLGCAMRSNEIDLQIVREAAGDLSLDQHGPKLPPRSRPVAKPQTQGRATSATLSSTNPLVPLMRAKLFQQRVFQVAIVAMLLLSVAIYLGTRAGAGTFRPEPPGDLPSTTARTGSDHRSAEAPVTTASDQFADPPPSGGQQNSSTVFTYVVQPNDTLRALCLSLVGHYDEAVQDEIRTLNPNLKDLTHLKPGQEIRLPLNASKPEQSRH